MHKPILTLQAGLAEITFLCVCVCVCVCVCFLFLAKIKTNIKTYCCQVTLGLNLNVSHVLIICVTGPQNSHSEIIQKLDFNSTIKKP